MPEDDSQELRPGTVLGDFTIERTLGQGGFGITYLAVDNTLGSRVVIKENLPFSFAYRDTTTLAVHSRRSAGDEGSYAWAVQNFLNEARTLASLDHPNIVKVTRAFSALGTAYFVMPYIKGDSLDKYRDTHGAPTEEWLRSLLCAMLDALTYLHGENLLHRDIKPANILLTAKGKPQLIDFGTARQLISEKSQTVIESPGYTPLEQMQTHGKVGAWSDLYALGGTLYKLITGNTPPKNSDRMARLDPYEPLAGNAALHGQYSASLLSSIDKALSIWPEDRWQTAAEWQQALGTPSSAPAEVKMEATQLPPEVTVTRPTPQPKPSAQGGSFKKWLLLGVCGTVLSLICLGGYSKYTKLKAQKEEVANRLRAVAEEEQRKQQAANAYEEGVKHYKDNKLSQAAECFRKAAEMGHATAQAVLGTCYEHGKGVPKDEKEAAAWYRKAAEQGLNTAQHNLAICYQLGRGVDKDMAQALHWFRKAAEQGLDRAQYTLGTCCIEGIGMDKNEAEAARWFRKAAEQGHASAQCYLGVCYERGWGVDKDLEKAVFCFRMAAEQGNAVAQNNLGLCYKNGLGLSPNDYEAMCWFRKAAEQGDANAQTNLATCYFTGRGIDKNEAEALRWYRKAADQGNAIAQHNVGVCYEYGRGVSQNKEEAKRWYRKAAEQGHSKAKEALNRLQ